MNINEDNNINHITKKIKLVDVKSVTENNYKYSKSYKLAIK